MESGANLEATTSKKKETPLLYATRQSKTECVCMLLKFGASVYCVDTENNTPFHWAARKKNPGVMGMLLKATSSEDSSLILPNPLASFRVTSISMTNRIVKAIAKIQSSLSEQNTSGRVPLHYAVLNNDLETTKMLICWGAESSTPDYYNNSSLHFAAQNGYHEAMKVLLSAKPKLDLVNYDGKTALNYTLENKFWDSAKLLISKGANITTQDDKGMHN